MARKFYLLSIILNQQARLELQAFRQQLFQEHGLVSALAFEPVIPLAWCRELPDSAPFARFSRFAGDAESAGPPTIETGQLHSTNTALFLQISLQPNETCDRLRAALPQKAMPTQAFSTQKFPDTAGLFPVDAGIFLAANEYFRVGSHPAERINVLIRDSGISFSPARIWNSSRIGAYTIWIQSEPWWQHVEWSLEWKIQLKGL